jgi:predicted NACHT family NTPase
LLVGEHLHQKLSWLKLVAIDIASALNRALESELRHSLQELKAQLLNLKSNKEIYLQWWQINGKNWIKRLNTLMIEQQNIGHDWQFSQQQWELLSQYYSANQLLVDCLNSDCYVSREVRQEIENTLLLPIGEIEKDIFGIIPRTDVMNGGNLTTDTSST